MNSVKRMIYLALMVSLAMVLSLMERMIPIPIAAPGVRLGLANVVTLFLLKYMGKKEALTVLLLRVFMVAIIAGRVSGLIYSLTGGILAMVAMILVEATLKDKVSEIGTSVVGAVFHNVGQISAAAIVLQTSAMFIYLPMMLFAAVITGIFVGYTVKYMLLHSKQINLKKVKV